MARLLGPDISSRLALRISPGRQVEALSGKTVFITTDAAGQNLANIAAYNGTGTPGAVIADSRLKLSEQSQVPDFWLPDGIDTVYATLLDRTYTFKITADVDARIDTVSATSGAAASQISALTTQVATNTSSIGTLTSGAATATSRLNSLDTSVGTNTTNIGTLTSRADAVKAQDGRPGIIVPPGWGTSWFAKLAAAKAGTGNAVVAFVGSSSTQGYYASNPLTKSFVALGRTALQTYAGNGGSGFQGMQWSATFFTGAPAQVNTNWTALGAVWTQGGSGSWSTPTFWHGPALGFLQGTSGATVTMTFDGTAVDLWFYNKWNPTVESFSYSIDSGAVTGTVTSGSGYGADLSAQYQSVTNLSAGTHTITITCGANGARIVGVRGRRSTGVTVDNYGIAGMESYGWSNQDSQNSGCYMGGWRQPADLVVIQSPHNDMIRATRTLSGNTGTTTSSAVLTNSNIRIADIGRVVAGTGVPLGAKIISVSEGNSFTIDQNATATGSVSVTLTEPDPVAKWLRNTQTYIDGVRDDRYGTAGGSGKNGAVDIVFLLPIIRTGSDTMFVKAAIASAMHGLAQYYGAALVDTAMTQRTSWAYAQSLGYMGNSASPGAAGNDETHQSDAGFQATWNELAKVIMPA
jgi:hypothetical protein